MLLARNTVSKRARLSCDAKARQLTAQRPKKVDTLKVSGSRETQALLLQRRKEKEAKNKYVLELRGFLDEAGDASALKAKLAWADANAAEEMVDAVLARGAVSTVRSHVSSWKESRHGLAKLRRRIRGANAACTR